MVLLFYFLVVSLPLVFWNDLFLPYDLPKAMLVRVVVLLLFCLIFVKGLITKKFTFVKRDLWLWIAVGGFFASALVSTIFSGNSAVSFWGSYYRQSGFLQMIFYFVLFLSTISFFTGYGDKKLALTGFLKVIAVGGVVTAIYAIFKAIFVMPELRISGSFGQTNFLATYLLMVLPFAVGFFMEEKKKLWQNFWLISVLVILTAMFLTLSRAMFLGVGGMGLFLVLWYKKYSWLIWVGILAIFVLILNIFKDYDFVAHNTFLSRFVFEGWAFQSVQTRFLIWEKAWDIFKVHPVFGHGPEMLAEAFKSYVPTRMFEYEEFNAFVDRAHNEVIEMAVTQGIVGVIFYLNVYFNVFRLVLKNAKRSVVMVACLASLVGIFFANLFSFSVVGHFVLWWLIIGVVICYCGESFTAKLWEKKKNLRLLSGVLVTVFSLYSLNCFVIKPLQADQLFVVGNYSEAADLNPNESFYVFAGVRNFLSDAENSFDVPSKQVAVASAADLLTRAQGTGFENTGEYWFLKARVDGFNGDNDLALVEFEKAHKYYARSNEIYWHWGWTLKALGRDDYALKKFDQYMELVPFWDWLEIIDQKTPEQQAQFVKFFEDNNQVLMLFDSMIELANKIGDSKRAERYKFYKDGIMQFQKDYYSAKVPV